MSQYDALAATAWRMIKAKGAVITLRQKLTGAYNPVTQAETGGGTTDTAVYAVLLPPGNSRELAPGTLVTRNIMEAWIATAGVSVPPQPGDLLVTASGILWTILTVTEYAPDGDSLIAWRAYVER
ncbi:hypothetical protein [Candidatus Contendibacter odensensis]|uniref:Phage tail protein n=1 Tax=Candidatus Contendobacter odensis Run_B_J11 TaxID=1400861 RepID=A0A7U7G8U7_9GAMM|nr:hypothetical protein [Candidatus Contendobacter odensis]CDH43847.1 hypothetical protein BN874_1370012 [Candidatus Contendobacter odensis Run_B_J11]